MAVLDTSALIHILKGTSIGGYIKINYLDELNSITAITLNELLVGIDSNRRKIIINYLKELEILPFDADAAEKSSFIEDELKQSGSIIGKLDIFIAAICIVKNLPLITTDNHFMRINGLNVLIPKTPS